MSYQDGSASAQFGQPRSNNPSSSSTSSSTMHHNNNRNQSQDDVLSRRRMLPMSTQTTSEGTKWKLALKPIPHVVAEVLYLFLTWTKWCARLSSGYESYYQCTNPNMCTAYDHPNGETYILEFGPALYFGDSMEHSLISPNQVRLFNHKLCLNPKQFT